eukprot:1543209-Pyramimonas_sp.AAC.1
MAQLAGEILNRMFNPNGHDLRYAGVHCDYDDGQSFRIHATLGIVLGDEAALHSIWLCKGSGGIKCCLHCANIVSKNWVAAGALDGAVHLKEYSKVSSLSECEFNTKATVQYIIDDLARSRPTMKKGEFKEKEQRLGWTDSRFNMLRRPELKEALNPPKQNVCDWAHNLLQ